MKKEGKHIIRFKTGGTKLQGAAYLREMAEQGWILEEMNHITYSFREGEPQYLKYRLEELEHAPTGEELAEYERDGWKKVCSYELEYIFAKERDPFEEDTEENKEEIIKDLDRQIEQERKNEKEGRYVQLVVVAIGLVLLFWMLGFSKETGFMAFRFVWRFAPWIVLAYFASRRKTKKLQKEQDKVREGDIADGYMDWRRHRKSLVKTVLMLTVIIGIWGYYAMGKNKLVYDLPLEIKYTEVPAPSLEKLEDAELIRVGGDVASQKAVRGDYSWRIYNNSVTEKKSLFIMEEVGIEQNMAPVGEATEIELSTVYNYFILEPLAKWEYKEALKGEEESYPGKNLSVRTILNIPEDRFDDFHICKREFVDETEIHILCREGKQLMNIVYNGQAEYEKICDEIEKVFLAQK